MILNKQVTVSSRWKLARHCNSMYELQELASMKHLKKKRDLSASDERKAKEKNRAADHIKLLKAKKVKLTTAVAAEAKAIDGEIAEL